MFSDPAHNIEQFDLEKGMHVADFGAGSGFYAIIAAKAVGEEGKIYAIDIQKDLLFRLKKEAERQGILNIEIIWGDIEENESTKLRAGSVDRVIVSNILFQIEKKEAVVQEVGRVLKPGGKVLVIDWTDSFNNMGPAPKHVFTEVLAKKLFEYGGFAIERSIQAGDHHYGFIAKRT